MYAKVVETTGTFLVLVEMNMPTFKDLDIGDMFNTKPARYVKISETEAIVVMSGIGELGFDIGQIHTFRLDQEVIPLYSNSKKLEELRNRAS